MCVDLGCVAAATSPNAAAPACAMPSAIRRKRSAISGVPLLSVQLNLPQGQLLSRLKRGALLQPDGSPLPPQAQSTLLNAGSPLPLHDEDIPRAGLQMSKGRRMSRWIDGSTWVRTAFRKRIGHGEGLSGLAFDRLLGQPGNRTKRARHRPPRGRLPGTASETMQEARRGERGQERCLIVAGDEAEMVDRPHPAHTLARLEELGGDLAGALASYHRLLSEFAPKKYDSGRAVKIIDGAAAAIRRLAS